MADCSSIRCIVQEMTDDQAVIIMVDSNLHREEILPSEKAFAYKMKLDAMKRQGLRTDLTSSPVATKFDAATELGKEYGDSRDQVFRYIRLTYLISVNDVQLVSGPVHLNPVAGLSGDVHGGTLLLGKLLEVKAELGIHERLLT